jgi:hypothetical protein
MNRRRLLLASATMALSPLAARAQTTTAGGCAIGFVHGLLRFSADCPLLTLPGLPYQVTPPHHLMPLPEFTGEVTDAISRPGRRRGRRANNNNNGKKNNNKNNTKKNNNKKKNNKKNNNKSCQMHLPYSFSGNGPKVTGKFCLHKGRFRAEATYVTTHSSGGLFVVNLFSETEQEDVIFIEDPSAPGTYIFEATVDSGTTGAHFLDIEEAGGTWTITIR